MVSLIIVLVCTALHGLARSKLISVRCSPETFAAQFTRRLRLAALDLYPASDPKKPKHGTHARSKESRRKLTYRPLTSALYCKKNLPSFRKLLGVPIAGQPDASCKEASQRIETIGKRRGWHAQHDVEFRLFAS
ncbi:uncharacterized protein UTRI_02393 [Ustilago trichophora]|uniref:Secreted protein n=1 Tax=Ustilago trichophora TaxID=86804 RepID=A0A5C3E6N5_9BASI|nr:uncharacterized protein UTRI_02393 [Ustilago trichophora]